MFKIYRFIIPAVMILLLVGAAMLYLRNPLGRPEIKIDLSRASVVKEMQALNRLETAAFTIEKIVEAGQQGNPFEDLLYGDRILLIAHGKVVAGIDMSALKEENVNIRGNTLFVTLPAPAIISSALDNSKTRVYDRTQGYLSRGNKDLESEARKAAEAAIRQAACEGGILEEARKNGTERIKQLFQFAGFTEVTVNIPEGKC